MEEKLLIKRAAKGDDSAFEMLAGAYQGKIYSICLRVLKNETDAADAMQNALIKIYVHIGKYSGKSSFSTWVYAVARNTALDFARSKKKEVSIEELLYLPDMQEGQSSTERRAEDNEQRRVLAAMINALPQEQRLCILLKDIDGYAIEEIAEIVKAPVGTVKSRLHRAREKLRMLLKEKEK